MSDRIGSTLRIVRDGRCVTTREVAEELGVSVSTARRDLDALEEAGLIRGIKHDERRTLPNGRIRVYWSALYPWGKPARARLSEERRAAV